METTKKIFISCKINLAKTKDGRFLRDGREKDTDPNYYNTAMKITTEVENEINELVIEIIKNKKEQECLAKITCISIFCCLCWVPYCCYNKNQLKICIENVNKVNKVLDNVKIKYKETLKLHNADVRIDPLYDDYDGSNIYKNTHIRKWMIELCFKMEVDLTKREIEYNKIILKRNEELRQIGLDFIELSKTKEYKEQQERKQEIEDWKPGVGYKWLQRDEKERQVRMQEEIRLDAIKENEKEAQEHKDRRWENYAIEKEIEKGDYERRKEFEKKGYCSINK